ncbi:MAG TPA: RNA polymerase sigma factor [Acidimicrobiia bacterium]
MVQLRDRVGLIGRPNRIERARRGDESAWAEIYHELAGPVTGYLAGLGVSDAEDLAGEVFLQVARDIHKFEGNESSFRSWVFVIAHRRAIDWRRAIRRRPPTADHPLPELTGGDVEDEAMERVETDRLVDLLDRLSEDQRVVLALRVIGDLSLEETAAVVGKTVGAVKALQHRALRTIRIEIEQGEVSL